jgi:hypothetical protein
VDLAREDSLHAHGGDLLGLIFVGMLCVVVTFLQGLRSWLEQRQEDATRTIDDFDRLNSIHNRMNYVASRRSQNDACQRGYDLAIEPSHKMPQARALAARSIRGVRPRAAARAVHR